MTENELEALGQMIQHSVPSGTGWVLVIVPPHDQENCTHCPLQTSSNLASERQMQLVLKGTAEMFENGTHGPMFVVPIEKVQ